MVATLEMALAILLEAALSFLGLGVPPPLPSWGLMIAEGKDYMFFSPWVIMIPGVALFVLVLGINLLGDGLRDLLGARAACDERAARRSRSCEVTLRRPHRGGARRLAHASRRGETHCLVGESGCGKSVTALAVMSLLARSAPALRRRAALRTATTCTRLSDREHGAAARRPAWR